MKPILVLLFLSGCLGNTEGQPIPKDKLYFPSALLKDNDTLYVVNANLDLQYKTGSISKIDVPSQKIIDTYLIPSMPGQAVFDGAAIYTTSQQNNSLVNALANTTLSLPFNAPYFIQPGLVGYLSPASNEPWDAGRFSLLADQSELQAYSVDASGNFQITKNYQVVSCFPTPAKNHRRMARIGGLQVVKNSTYVLAEFYIDDPADNNKFLRHVFLIKTVPGDKLCDANSVKIDITETEKAQAARGLVVSDTGIAYVLLDEGPLLVAIDLNAPITTQRTTTCKGPSTVKLSPDQKTLLVACSKSNELTAYDTSNLVLFGNVLPTSGDDGKSGSPLTGGPLDILFDGPSSKKIYVSYQQDHKVGIFEYENSAPNNRSLDFKQWLKLSR